ncbi:MAG TPA: response regulator [Candidatus Eisenbacteria bacterium]|jgi:DNA-binding response OmpR family regulator
MPGKILVVEDDADLHIGLALRLTSHGYEVLSALDGEEAVDLCRQQRPDLVLMDIGLPGKDGHDVARQLSTLPNMRDVPVVYLTARHEAQHRLEAAGIGAAAYLVKPTTTAKLFAAIGAALPASQY